MYSQVADSTDNPRAPEKKPIRAVPVPSGTEDNLLNQTCWKSPTPSRHDKPQVSFMAAVENKTSAAVSDCTDSGSCTAVSAQRSSTPNPEIVQPSGSLQHVSPEPSEELAVRRQLDASRSEQSHIGRPPHGEGGVWNQATFAAHQRYPRHIGKMARPKDMASFFKKCSLVWTLKSMYRTPMVSNRN